MWFFPFSLSFSRRARLQCGCMMCFSVHNMRLIPTSFWDRWSCCCQQHTVIRFCSFNRRWNHHFISMQIFNVNFCARIWRNKNQILIVSCVVHSMTRFERKASCVGNMVTELNWIENSRSSSNSRCQHIAKCMQKIHSINQSNHRFQQNIERQPNECWLTTLLTAQTV